MYDTMKGSTQVQSVVLSSETARGNAHTVVKDHYWSTCIGAVVSSSEFARGNAVTVAGDHYRFTCIAAVVIGRWSKDQMAEC